MSPTVRTARTPRRLPPWLRPAARPLLAVLLVLSLGAAAAGCIAGSDATPPPIPAHYLALYQRWGHVCSHVDWSVLAGIGEVESDHGRYPGPGVTAGTNGSGAGGPMQFLATTYQTERRRHPHIGPDLYDPADAIPAAAYLLCDLGAARDLDQAIHGYNHSWSYVDQVESVAAAYRGMPAAKLIAPPRATSAAGQ